MSEETQPLDPTSPSPETDSSATASNPADEAAPSAAAEKICAVCGVKIIAQAGGDRIVFSAGPEGTRAKLWARVCQFVNKPDCLNRDKTAIGTVTDKDYFRAELGGNLGGSQ